MATGTAIARPRRWDEPFGGATMAETDVERVLAQPVFAAIDQERFPASQPLPEILRNDGRVVRFDPGDVIVREGDYGNSVFVVLSGSVSAVLDRTTDAELGRRTHAGRRSMWQALKQLWANNRESEARDIQRYFHGRGDVGVRGTNSHAQSYIAELSGFLARHTTASLGPGETFGEIAALARQPRTATVVATEATEVVELRWQGLRDIRKRDRGFRDHVDGLYRERRLAQQLEESPLFAHLSPETLAEIAHQTSFETHGSVEWFRDYKQVKARDPSAVVEHEPVIAEEGSYLDGLMLIVSGFCRVSERLGHGHRTVSYVSRNNVFGLAEICAHHWHGEPLTVRRSLRGVGSVDVLRIPTGLVERHVLPNLPADQLPPLPARAEETQEASEPDTEAQAVRTDTDLGLPQDLVDFFVDQRTINGTATMLIDTNRCTGCDDCIRACASTHDNNPRFKRHGPIHDGIQVTNACMHCADPVCMIGCPTGAIHRHASGPVVIDDATCIGCGTCAESCPYDNISMVEIRGQDGGFVIDQEANEPIQKATKCDLCYDQLGGPACQRACPHDALIRVDMRDTETLADWISRT